MSLAGLGGATMRGLTAMISPMRAAAPAACDTSFHTSDNCPSAPAPNTAKRTNCDSAPPVIRWAITSWAPSQSTTTTLPKARKSAAAVTKARASLIARAAS